MSKKNKYTAPTLKRWREGKGITQQQAGELLGISQSLYSRYEAGKFFPLIPRAVEFERICGIPVSSWGHEDYRPGIEDAKVAVQTILTFMSVCSKRDLRRTQKLLASLPGVMLQPY